MTSSALRECTMPIYFVLGFHTIPKRIDEYFTDQYSCISELD